MHIINVRHKQYLHCCKAIALFALIFNTASVDLSAQNRIIEIGNNQADYDRKLLHYGFYIAPKMTYLKHLPSQEFDPYAKDTTLMAIHTKTKPGLSVGFVVSLRVEEYLDLRFLPGISIGDREMQFRFLQADGTTYTVNSEVNPTFLDLPILLKYKSKRRGDVRMYVVGGLKPSLEVGKKDEITEGQFKMKGNDLTFEIGMGMDMYFPLVKFSPELRFSKGMTDLRNPGDDNIYTNSMRRVTSQTITLFLFFE